jgi:hypothetical protein
MKDKVKILEKIQDSFLRQIMATTCCLFNNLAECKREIEKEENPEERFQAKIDEIAKCFSGIQATCREADCFILSL